MLILSLGPRFIFVNAYKFHIGYRSKNRKKINFDVCLFDKVNNYKYDIYEVRKMGEV